MKSVIKLGLVLIVLSFVSCSGKVYKDKSFFSDSKPGVQSLAALPAEIIFTGNLPKNWNTERITKMESEQSYAIQESVYDQLLLHAKSNTIRSKWEVSVMDYRIINSKLESSGISLKDSWKIPSNELAKILGTDMLVRAKVQNQRIMSEAAAAGINVGVSVLRDVLSSSTASPVYVPRAKANESDMSLTLYHSSRPSAVARVSSEKKLKVKKLPVYVRN